MPTDSKQPPKMLLDLPPEILEHVLLRLDAPSFSVMIMTCRTIRSHVMASLSLLLSHLLRVPGFRVNPGDISREEMLRLFCQRASEHAQNGVSVFLDTIVFKPLASISPPLAPYSNMSSLWTCPKLSLLQRCASGLSAAAVDLNANIHVYRINQGHAMPKYVLQSKNLDVDGQSQVDRGDVRLSVVALTFQLCQCESSPQHFEHIVALYRYQVDPAPPGHSQTFIASSIRRLAYRLKLVVWKFCEGQISSALVHDVALESSLEEPVFIVSSDLVVQKRGTAPISIVFRIMGAPPLYHVRTYFYAGKNENALQTVSVQRCQTFPLTDGSSHLSFPKPIYRVTARAERELLFYSEDLAPSHTVVDCTSETQSLFGLPQTVSGDILRPTIGIYRGHPLDVAHHHECGVLADGNKYCINSILQLVFPQKGSQGAYLIKGVENVHDCRNRGIDDNFAPMEHVFVAKLLGTDTPSTSPMKRIVAVSKERNRIAIADWNVLKIWAINTKAFLKKDFGSLSLGTRAQQQTQKAYRALRSEEPDEDDLPYTNRCGHGYYHSYARIKGREKRLVAIEPTELLSRGVIFSMEFENESELWAWTDHGLVKWYWGKGRKGMKETRLLTPVLSDIWT